jgi:hypothetical protein
LWVIPPVCKVQDSSTLCLLRRRLEWFKQSLPKCHQGEGTWV